MPTLQQLPQATTVATSDQVLIEKDGIAFVSDVGTLLNGTQPRLTFAPNTLVGRVNPIVAGGPEPVSVGSGLIMQGGQLSVDSSRIPPSDSPAFTGVPTAPTRPLLDASTALATTAFVQANVSRAQSVTLTGDVTGAGVGSVSTTLPQITTAGTFSKVQVNAKGQVVSGSALVSADVVPLLPIATTSSTGVVKIGSGLVVQPDGGITVNTGLRTVQDFGAIGDGVADDTAAFAAYGAWLRQQRSVNGAQQSWVLGFGRRYIINDSLDFTKFKYVTFDGQSSQIISNVKNFAVIDALGMENCIIQDLEIYAGSPNNPALVGLQLGMYIDNQGHPQNSIQNLVVTGYYSQSCIFNAGSETCVFTNLKMVNRYIGSQWCYALIQDATGFWPIVSKYVAVARTRNAAMSFNENSFIEPVVEMYGGGPAVWMSATHRHSYRGGYMIVQTGFPAAVLNFLDILGSAHSQSLLEWDVHAEVAPTSIFLLTGYTSPRLAGLLLRDHLVQATNVFAATADVTTVTVSDAKMEIPDFYSTIGASQSVFDTPSKYSIQGEIYINSQSAAAWSPPATFVGSLYTDNIAPFSFGVGTAFAQSPGAAKIAGPLTLTGSLTVGGAVTVGSLSMTGSVNSSLVWAGPTSGSAAPNFRSLVASDVGGVEILSNKAVANGYASLDSGGRIPASQLPAGIQGALVFQGYWDASANIPSLASGVGTKGYYYTASVSGTVGLDGVSQWLAGDHVVFNGTKWEKFGGSAVNVLSVAGRTGAVTLSASDVSGLSSIATSGRFSDLIAVPALPAAGTPGIVRSDGSAFGAVAIGDGLSFVSGALSVSGVVMSNTPIFGGNTRRTVGSAIAAAGTSQATATILANDYNEVSNVSSGSNSVLLPDPGIGAEIVLRNAQGSSALLVYPPVGQSIDIGSINNPFSMGANSTKTFRKMSATKWYSQ